MSSFFGQHLHLSLFGQSHGEAIGITMDGFPAGMTIDMERVAAEMKRRAPGQSSLTTPRKEADAPEILSGVLNGRTTGQPICAIIRNTNTRSKDYGDGVDLLRPGHADYTGHV
ncbi:MAG: chorismate synthase, partial [Clostridia bacterium]|nr:chorismate synthase [Clostridia bacterium]